MSHHAVIVLEDGYPSFVAGHHDSLGAAKAQSASMASEIYGMPPRFVYDGNDDVVIVDDDCAAVSVWNRHEEKSAAGYAAIDFAAYLSQEARRQSRRILGFRITDLEGRSIHGTDEDPFELPGDAVLTGAAVLTAKAWAGNLDYLVSEVFVDDAEASVLVEEISEKTLAVRI